MLEENLKYFKATSVLLDKATKSPTGINVVSAFGLMMFSKWAKLAKPLIKEAGGKSTSSTGWVDPFIKKIDKKMGTYQSTIDDEQVEYTEYLYKYFKNEFIKRNKIQIVEKANLPEITPILWLEQDEEALAALRKMTSGSTGKFYKTSVQQAVQDSIKFNIIESNLPLDEAVAQMKRDLSKALKMTPGQMESKVVPPGYTGTAESYFTSLADHTASLSRTTGAVFTMDEVDAKKMIIRSVRSKRTCLGCLEMDGMIYDVSKAKKHTDKMLGADNVGDLKKLQPFFHYKTPDEYSETELANAQASAKAEANSGFKTPPFHFRCECFVDMV